MAERRDTVQGALRAAYSLLRHRDRSEREMRDRLAKKGYSEQTIAGAVEKLLNAGYLDDRRLAENLKRIASERKQLGNYGVNAYLHKRGICREVIESVSGDADEVEVAERLVGRKAERMITLDAETKKKRLWGILARRGFSAATIRTVLSPYGIGRTI
ncbi:MAG TPA: regulatory protein RecX [Dissulfurispiraceae bacterium]|nr:regulatory protein RecX [Dissulfurispiraceae bacterium]